LARPASEVHGVRRVLEVAQGVISELDLDVVLQRVVAAACELSGARFAALGVLGESRTELEGFFTAGMDEETRRGIAEVPRGRGVLGELIEHPVSVRLADVASHPRAYGFPSGHPPMKTFLGVPVMVRGRPFGNLYLADKAGGAEFSEQDQEHVELLAELAGVAIDHARRYSGLRSRHGELKQTVEALEATIQIAHALGGETDLQAVLDLVAKRGRALVAARALVIEYGQAGELVMAAAAGELRERLAGERVDLHGTVADSALRTGNTMRLEDEPNMMRFERHGAGRLGVQASAGLVVPLIFRGQSQGVLLAIDRLKGGPAFTAEDQRLLEAFAASAATAIATAESVEAERRRQRLAAAEEERTRWARELHDETLQSLAALRLGLAAQLRAGGDPAAVVETVRESVVQLDRDIATLRALITDLRPAALDDLGAEAAIEDLARRAQSRGLEVAVDVELAQEPTARLTTELETAVYRIVQEALTNAEKHGHAHRASVEVQEEKETVRVTVRDDGRGFDPGGRFSGFGVTGMRERAELIGGTLDIESAPGHGSTVQATLPKLTRVEPRPAHGAHGDERRLRPKSR
jgi:two-component system, NarL family, sensor histidine kinase DevS